MSISTEVAASFAGPRKFRQAVNFAQQCALARRPFADAERASGTIEDDENPDDFAIRWSTGPAGIRAAQALDERMAAAYQQGQIEVACEAICVCVEDNFDPADFDIHAEESLIDSAVLVATGATHACDGELSTLITPTDIVDIIAAHFPITDRKNAEWLAERALIDIHVPYRDPTPESTQEVREELAFVEAWTIAPNLLGEIHPTTDLAEALMERIPHLTPRDPHGTNRRRAGFSGCRWEFALPVLSRSIAHYGAIGPGC